MRFKYKGQVWRVNLFSYNYSEPGHKGGLEYNFTLVVMTSTRITLHKPSTPVEGVLTESRQERRNSLKNQTLKYTLDQQISSYGEEERENETESGTL